MSRSQWYCALIWAVIAAMGSGSACGQAAGSKVVRIELTPAAAPDPALRHVLIPEMSEQQPGNAEPLLYLSCQLLPRSDAGRKTGERIRDWLDQPAETLPRDKVKAALAEYGNALHYTFLATRREYCHFDLPFRQEGLGTALPNLGAHRDIARALALRIRVAVLERRHDEALRDLQTGVVLARYVGAGPTIINALVGAAIGRLMCDQLAGFAGSGGSPNLYWALASVPRPFIDVSAGLRVEHCGAVFDLPQLFQLDRIVLTRADIDQILARLIAMGEIEEQAGDLANANAKVLKEARTVIPTLVEPARRYLLAHGYTAERLAPLPAEQIVFMHALDRGWHWLDEELKWFNLPYWQGAEQMAQVEAMLETKRQDPAEGFFVMAGVPVKMGHVYASFAQAERHLSAVQCIEAIRMYAAAHAGALPPSLAAITEVPVPLDPVSGQPFAYRLQDGAAVLDLPAPPRARPGEGRRYELRVAAAR